MKKNHKYGVWDSPALKKCLLIMRLFLVISLISVMQTFALNAYTQNTRISLSVAEMKLEEIIMRIENDTYYRFAYDKNEVNVDKAYSVNVKNAEMEQLLNQLFSKGEISYTIVGRQIVLSPSNVSAITQQGLSISGRVTDSSGSPLPGVTVVEKGSKNGVVTDTNGNYSLDNVRTNAILVFSFVGMKTGEAQVNGKTLIDLTMEEETIGIGEVVAIGYGTTTKQKMVSSVSTLKTDKIERVPYKTIAESLAGRVAGVFVQTDNGDGALPQISIRGGGDPLYIVDGIKQTKEFFSMIPSTDIENISFLKDASAGAVYGAEAGDGVVLVMTKKGAGEGFKVNYSGNFSFETRSIKPDYLTPYEYALMANEAAYMDGRSATYSDEMVNILKANTDPKYIATDVYDAVVNKFRPLTNHNLSLNGHSGNTSAFFSVNYQTEGSEFKWSNTQGTDRYSIRSDISHKIENLGLTVSGHFDAQKYVATFPYNGSANIWINLRTLGITMGPLINPQGNFIIPMNSVAGNPAAEASDKAGYSKRQKNWMNSRLTFEWDVPWIKGLKLMALGNYLFDNTDNKSWSTTSQAEAQRFTWDNVPIQTGQPTLSQSKDDNFKLDFQTQINYNKTFLNDHTVSLTAVYNQYESRYNVLSGYRRDYLSSAVDQIFAGSTTTWSNNGYTTEEARRGWVGRAKYDFKSRYIVEFSFRYDGSDNFPKDKRWGFFPAISAGWNIANEPFMQGLDKLLGIDALKVRGSWGKTGMTGGGGRFGYISAYNLVNNNYYSGGNWQPGFTEGPLVSNDFTWYDRTSYNLGLDFALLTNKLNGSLDWFFYRTTNYLASPGDKYTTPLGKSLPQVVTNSAHRRAGAEFTLMYHARLNALNINIGGNLAYYNQLWEKKYDEPASVLGNPYTRLTHETDYYTVGYMSDGYYQNINEVIDNPRLMGREVNWPGNVKYRDMNGDGKVDSYDQRKIGTSGFPHLTYGTTLDVSWKGFKINTLIQGTSNRQIYLGTTWYGAIHNKQYAIQADSWTPDNPDAKFPRNSYVVNEYGTTSDFFLINAWYVRLKALSVSYDFKTLFPQIQKVSELSVILSGTNLVTFSPTMKYDLDPEVEANSSHQMRQPPRVFSLGLRIGL